MDAIIGVAPLSVELVLYGTTLSITITLSKI